MTTENIHEEAHHAHGSLYTIARRLLLAGMGAFTLAQEEMETILNRLVEHGELAEKDARKLIKEMMEKREEMLKERRAAHTEKAKETISKTDLEALQQRIAELTRQVEELKKQRSGE